MTAVLKDDNVTIRSFDHRSNFPEKGEIMYFFRKTAGGLFRLIREVAK